MLDNERRRVYEIIEGGKPGVASRAFDVFIMTLIVANVVTIMLETVVPFAERHMAILHAADAVAVAVFTAEYLLRLWTCTVNPRYGGAVLGRLRFALTAPALIDLAVLLPFFLPMLPVEFGAARSLRLLRLFRVLKIGRYSTSVRTLGNVVRRRKGELLVTLFTLSVLLIIASTLMYLAERKAQPEEFSSIPAAMWWAITTLSTVGYGDVVPLTALGKVVGAFAAVVGIGFFGLPAGILAAGFMEEMRRTHGEHHVCPHCGKDIS